MRRVIGGLLVAGAALALMAADAGAASRKSSTKQASYNPIAWSRTDGPAPGPAQAIGGYAAGCLAGGVALPGEGVGYQVIRLSRQRNYGHPVLVDYLKGFGRRMAASGLGTALVADMAQARGGPMSFGHASHQSGLDADIWLRLDLPALSRKARETVDEVRFIDYDRSRVTAGWTGRHAEMVRLAAEDPRVSRIFVGAAIKQALCRKDWKDREWLRKVRPWHGHDGHMHVRLSCPPGSPQCEEQRELPPGDGCGEELQGWLSKAVPAMEIPPEKARPRNPQLPPACHAVLRSTGVKVASAGEAGVVALSEDN